jgi:hypothetical protein
MVIIAGHRNAKKYDTDIKTLTLINLIIRARENLAHYLLCDTDDHRFYAMIKAAKGNGYETIKHQGKIYDMDKYCSITIGKKAPRAKRHKITIDLIDSSAWIGWASDRHKATLEAKKQCRLLGLKPYIINGGDPATAKKYKVPIKIKLPSKKTCICCEEIHYSTNNLCDTCKQIESRLYDYQKKNPREVKRNLEKKKRMLEITIDILDRVIKSSVSYSPYNLIRHWHETNRPTES